MIPEPYEPPLLAAIPTQYPTEDENWTLDLTGYITDPDTPLENLTITENSSFGELHGAEIIFNYPNGVTGEHVNVTIADERRSASRNVFLVVRPVNDAPEIVGAPVLLEAREDEDKVFDLTPFVFDVDNELADMTAMVNTSFARIDGLNITFNYPNGIRREQVNVSLYDGDSWTHHHLELKVENVNDPPEWGDGDKILADHEISGIAMLPFYLRENITLSIDPCIDIDGDLLTYTWDLGDEGAEQSGVDLIRVNHSYFVPGDYNVNLTVSDPDGASIETTLAIVLAVDYDRDGIDDAWELLYGLDPSTGADAGLDPDGDNYTNYEEFKAGTMDPWVKDAEKHPDYEPPVEDDDITPGDDDDNDKKGDDDNGNTGTESTGEGSAALLWLVVFGVFIILIVIISIPIIVLIVVLRSRKKGGGEESEAGPDTERDAHGRVGPGSDAIQVDPASGTVVSAPVSRQKGEISNVSENRYLVDHDTEWDDDEVAFDDDTVGNPVCGYCGRSSTYYPEHECYWCEPCQEYVYD